jgi:hypothetical protein
VNGILDLAKLSKQHTGDLARSHVNLKQCIDDVIGNDSSVCLFAKVSSVRELIALVQNDCDQSPDRNI